jgi:hypothetical protein
MQIGDALFEMLLAVSPIIVRRYRVMAGSTPGGEGGPITENFELREGGSYELREDGSLEQREGP